MLSQNVVIFVIEHGTLESMQDFVHHYKNILASIFCVGGLQSAAKNEHSTQFTKKN